MTGERSVAARSSRPPPVAPSIAITGPASPVSPRSAASRPRVSRGPPPPRSPDSPAHRLRYGCFVATKRTSTRCSTTNSSGTCSVGPVSRSHRPTGSRRNPLGRSATTCSGAPPNGSPWTGSSTVSGDGRPRRGRDERSSPCRALGSPVGRERRRDRRRSCSSAGHVRPAVRSGVGVRNERSVLRGLRLSTVGTRLR